LGIFNRYGSSPAGSEAVNSQLRIIGSPFHPGDPEIGLLLSSGVEGQTATKETRNQCPKKGFSPLTTSR